MHDAVGLDDLAAGGLEPLHHVGEDRLGSLLEQRGPVRVLLRAQTLAIIAAVRELLNSGQTPSPDFGKRCKACSLVEICHPELLGKRDRSVGYVEGLFEN